MNPLHRSRRVPNEPYLFVPASRQPASRDELCGHGSTLPRSQQLVQTFCEPESIRRLDRALGVTVPKSTSNASTGGVGQMPMMLPSVIVSQSKRMRAVSQFSSVRYPAARAISHRQLWNSLHMPEKALWEIFSVMMLTIRRSWCGVEAATPRR
jgi:hypothetical protein